MPVIAINSKGQKQEFNDLSWKMMSTMNHDWKEIPEQVTVNTLNPIVKLPTGEKAKEVIIKNIVNETVQEISNKKEGNVKDQKITTADKKAEFLKAVEGTSASMIKDYFDKFDVPYHKKAKIEELTNDFAEYLEYDLEAFQKAFQ